MTARIAEAFRTDSIRRLRDLLAAEDFAPPWPAAALAAIHDLKGQGTSFGYPLVTGIGEQLLWLERQRGAAGVEPEILTAHLKSLLVVIERDIKGMGGAAGAAVLKRLSMLAE